MATTLAQLRTRARQRADMENSTFIEDAELNQYINDSYSELYDLVVSRFEDYFMGEPTSFTISAGSSTYSLPSDFYKLVGLDRLISGSDYYSVRPFSFMDRNNNKNYAKFRGLYPNVSYRLTGSVLRLSPTDEAPGSYRIWYIPSFTALSTDSSEVDSVISRHNWDEFIAIDAAIKMLAKEESDVNVLAAQKASIVARIEQMAQNRDVGDTDRITDVTMHGFDDPWFYR